MLDYTIQAALKSKINDVIVSTDSDKVAEIAKKSGAQVPFIRPNNISDDRTTNKKVLLHAVNFMESTKSKKYDLLFVLQPTSPIRSYVHINDCIDLLGNSMCDSIASIFGPIKKNQKHLKVLSVNNRLLDYHKGENRPYFKYNASIYGAKRNFFLETGDYHSGQQIGYVMDKIHSVDIDDEIDFKIASHLLNAL